MGILVLVVHFFILFLRRNRAFSPKATGTGLIPILLPSAWVLEFRVCVTASFQASFLAATREANRLLFLALMEMVVNGVSTRKVAEITEELRGTRISKSLAACVNNKL